MLAKRSAMENVARRVYDLLTERDNTRKNRRSVGSLGSTARLVRLS